MVETYQRPTGRSHAARCYGVLLATALLVATPLLPIGVALGQDQRAQLAISTVGDLAANGEALKGKHVLIKGEVVDVGHVPSVIDGVSMYFFTVSDGTGKIRIASPMAAMFVEGDLVRVEGVYQVPRPSSPDSVFIDAYEGTIEVLKASKSKLSQILRAPRDDVLAVPTSPVITIWSRGIAIATVVLAFLAVLFSQRQQMRRFNIGLTLDLSPRPSIEAGRLQIEVRAISTRSYPPQVRPEAVLKTNRMGQISGSVWRSGTEANESAAVMPVPIFSEETLRLEFPIPEKAKDEDLSRAKVVLQDALCRKRFVVKLTETNRSYVDANELPGGGPARDSAAASEKSTIIRN